MGAQPEQTLRRYDCSTPNKGPFLAPDVFCIQILREIVSKEDGPDDGEGPNVSVEVEWHCKILEIFSRVINKEG